MVPLMFGIIALIWAGINLRKFLLFTNGIKTKGIVIKAISKEQRVGKGREMIAEITYKYIIEGQEYENIEISNESRHTFKTHTMEGEPISLMVWRNKHEKSTCLSVKNYKTALIAFVLMGIISILIGIAIFK
ncbi:hypothetical protein [Tenacibaculum caenipelagi]|uniref:DUF3592 domain-containing protein n=1 Tax=Tenacibaculum caenipelagi TaxID=1325435 RepID=A0A4R6TGF4_9FLAO|nr:hypothetical protein [Tenacibaculum caenipelagi]TDQ25728.1 hypothetical protein DFQ07_2158 [Tenacibaculum caenipelagi]